MTRQLSTDLIGDSKLKHIKKYLKSCHYYSWVSNRIVHQNR